VSTPPHHVAVIMDGNGPSAGEGAIVARVRAAVRSRVSWLSLVAFSTENRRRPQPEVDILTHFNQRVIRDNARAWNDVDVRMVPRRRLRRFGEVPQSVAGTAAAGASA
jgi:undecaprenyl diphosphate synthase